VPRILRPLVAAPVKQPAEPSQDDQALLSRVQGVLQRGGLVVRAQTVQALQVGGDATVQRRLTAGTLTAAAATVAGVNLAKLPRGELAYFETTASSGTFTTETNLLISAQPITVDGTRKVRVSAQVILSCSTVDIVQLGIKEGTTQIMLANGDVSVAGGNTTVRSSRRLVPSAGTHTYFLTGNRGGSTGTVQQIAAASFVSWIMVEDVGGV
jgi:hypothetical protein